MKIKGKMEKAGALVAATVERQIFMVRGQAVMMDAHLAGLYGVQTKVLLQAVKRNHARFPEDFMFQLSKEEAESLRSQIVTLESGRGKHRKYLPYAFTEHGVAMLSSVLRSEKAVQVNIEIMRAFVGMKKALLTDRELSRRMDKAEGNISEIDSDHANTKKQVRLLSGVVQSLIEPPAKPKRKIGFRKPD